MLVPRRAKEDHMSVTILPRATWGQYVPDPFRQPHAMGRPEPSSGPWEPHRGGVFIHHRGRADPLGREYGDEQECLTDIAFVYIDHTNDDRFNGDVAYNYFICQHGNVYEGRGYERGEANAGDAGDAYGVGRNTGFYSICALMRLNHVAGEPLLRAYRALIQHLRDDAPDGRRAGPRIVPHSLGYNTECPGNLTMYAHQGSTIDPSAPWRGLADLYTHRAQEWVNDKYYGNAPGYLPVLENGRTGWPTVLCLTQGLQYELGISPTVQNFGPGTFNAVKARNTLPADETNSHLKGIYNSALWCKGYWASSNLEEWTGDSEQALRSFYADAGLDYGDVAARRRMFPHVVKALCRMDQFRQVSGGTATVQGIQRRLNARYVAGIGIPAMSLVPCDGIYSRDVQQGMMMAIQYEIGIPLSSINGYFGPGTQAGLQGPGAAVPLTGDLRYLFRAACIFNSPTMVPDGSRWEPLMYRADDLPTDTETASHLNWVRAFQRFSQIPQTTRNDYTTWAQLLVSSGDTARHATGCDCITEITATRARQLWDGGYRIVGRYLDEHLPPGDPYFLDKALKPNEPQTILDAGLRFFPIFQYNGTQLVNFLYEKGLDQGRKAHHKAVEHRIPAGTCIYFAVDYDALDVDIDSNIKPYFQGVRDGLAELGYRYTFGVYGSRNVCTRVSEEVGAAWSLVSGMSWGYSGNLGFPLPANWSFNQIREFEFKPGWGLDHDVWREGADPGVYRLESE
jgi:peptidoglycan hydrolase-like protein with peptidoglycan-binding domain